MKRTSREFRVDPAQLQAPRREVALDPGAVRLGDATVEPDEHLPCRHALALSHEDRLHDARIGGLYHLHSRAGDQLAVRHGHDIEVTDVQAGGQQGGETDERMKDGTRQR
jgi:hypothetical protein